MLAPVPGLSGWTLAAAPAAALDISNTPPSAQPSPTAEAAKPAAAATAQPAAGQASRMKRGRSGELDRASAGSPGAGAAAGGEGAQLGGGDGAGGSPQSHALVAERSRDTELSDDQGAGGCG